MLRKIAEQIVAEMMQPLFNPDDPQLGILNNINAPFVQYQVSTLGGKDRASILLRVSLDPKDQWANGIFQNSKFMQFRVSINGEAEQFTLSHVLKKKFRKTKVKSLEEFVNKANKYIEIVKGA